MRLLTLKELHEKYPFVSQSLLYLWIEQRELAHFRLGGKGRRGRIMIDEDDFATFLASRKIEPGQLRQDSNFTHGR